MVIMLLTLILISQFCWFIFMMYHEIICFVRFEKITKQKMTNKAIFGSTFECFCCSAVWPVFCFFTAVLFVIDRQQSQSNDLIQ